MERRTDRGQGFRALVHAERQLEAALAELGLTKLAYCNAVTELVDLANAITCAKAATFDLSLERDSAREQVRLLECAIAELKARDLLTHVATPSPGGPVPAVTILEVTPG